MAAPSKREQARNERDLQDLLRLPGNSTCADCGTRNPAWASWNLGIFLCMRCASIHRKLGTHISKVKSLSMDKWSSDQVETMKQTGNIASNKVYNPKNKKPDMPLDADEVDSAMERFIRKKYQEKSLVDGRPEPPSRLDVSPSIPQSHSPQPSPNPELPSAGKKHKFFGFSLRTSSKKDRPGVDNAFKITPVEYSPTSGKAREVSDQELQVKLAQLRDMGFPENERNLAVLKRSGGDLERTIAALVKMGPSEPAPRQTASPAPAAQSAKSAAAPAATSSNNPFEQLDQREAQQSSGFGISFDAPQQPSQPAPTPSGNPWQAALPQQQQQQQQQYTGLEQQFTSMQVSNPLFPHHTGGYVQSSQDPRYQTMTPPVPLIPQHYGNTSSPSPTASNPFYQPPQPLSSQSTGNNPFLQQMQSRPAFAPTASVNPFFNMQQPTGGQQQLPSNSSFGFASAQPQPSQSSMQQFVQNQQPQSQYSNPFGLPQQTSPPPLQQSQTFPMANNAPSPGQQIPNFNYGQAQPSQVPAMQQPQQQAFYQDQQYQPQALQAQQTGRYTKTDIMALFNNPSPYQQQSLAPVQEAQEQQQFQQNPQQQQSFSPAPSNNPYGQLGVGNTVGTAKRSATMPIMHSQQTSRNPFLSTQSSQSSGMSTPQQMPPQGYAQGFRHASNESVSVNNPSLMDGRHSPDAFASLSSRY